MLEFHPLQEHQATPARLTELLLEAKAVLLDRGMASMDEYGDMLKWGLPKRDGMCRYIHVYHPGYCSFSDAFYGTIHFHGGEIRGTVLAGEMEHYTYRAVADAGGTRFFAGASYSLTKFTHVQGAGKAYSLPARVPHWLKPTQLTMTYFEEEDNDVMGDLVNPDGTETDDFAWEQEDADALLPELLALIEQELARLSVVV